MGESKRVNKTNRILKWSLAWTAMLVTVTLAFGMFGTITPQKKFNRIQPGMTKAEVADATSGKEPADKRYEGGKEMWIYDVIGSGGMRAKKVVFVDGLVVEISDDPVRQKVLDELAAQQASQMEASKEEREKVLYGQVCIVGNSSRQCPYPNQICVVENSGDVQGICTITCGDDFDCSPLETNTDWLKCVDLYRGTRACWK